MPTLPSLHTLALAVGVGVAAPAAAQAAAESALVDPSPPSSTTPSTTPSSPPTPPTPSTTTPAATEPPSTLTPTPSTPSTPSPSVTVDHRPSAPWSFGVGAGYVLNGPSVVGPPGTSLGNPLLLTPNAASARLRFAGVVLEPAVRASVGYAERALGTGDEPAVFTSWSVAVDAIVRVPVVARGPLDLQALAIVTGNVGASGASFADESQAQSAAGASLGYGIGIEWFVVDNVAISADATNSLASVSRTVATENAEESPPDLFVDLGLIFAPQVRALVHLYF